MEKERLFLSKKSIFEHKPTKAAKLSQSWPDFYGKKGENRSISPKNAILYLIKNIFQVKPLMKYR